MAEDPFERYEFKGGIPPPALSNEELAEAIRAQQAERMRLSLTPPEKSVVQKIEEANTWIRKIADGKLSKDAQAQWAVRLRNALRPLYGEKAPLVQTFESWRKELARNRKIGPIHPV